MEQNCKTKKTSLGLLIIILICSIVSLICNTFMYIKYERQVNELKEDFNLLMFDVDTVYEDDPLVDTIYFIGNNTTENVE